MTVQRFPRIEREPGVDPRLCAKCRVYKPRSSFGPQWKSRDGLGSWCRQCGRANSTSVDRSKGVRPRYLITEELTRMWAIRKRAALLQKELNRSRGEISVGSVRRQRKHASGRARHWTYQGEKNRALVLARGGECEIKGLGCLGTARMVDHIVPKKLGGTDDLSNLQAACRHCNQVKGTE